MDKEIYNTDEACELLGCSRMQLWKLRKDGLLKAFRMGRKVQYRREAIRECLKLAEQREGEKQRAREARRLANKNIGKP